MGKAFDDSKPVIVALVIQAAYAAMTILLKMASSNGTNRRILVAYRFMFATVSVAPFAFIFERKKRPSLTKKILFQTFLCGLFGGLLNQNLYMESLALTSATFVAAITNLIPAITFILAICFRLEEVGLKTLAGKAKLVGTLVGIGGAMILTFYKGGEIKLWSVHINILSHQPPPAIQKNLHQPAQTVLGCSLAVAACVSYSLWLIVQTKMSTQYTCHYSSTALISLMGTIQCTVFALCTERDWKKWKLDSVGLFAAAYTGIVTSGLIVAVIAWCVVKRGPLFLTVFSPLSVLLVAIAGSLLLDEKLYTGCVIGAALIVCGLYMVVWGKNKEMKKKKEMEMASSRDQSQRFDNQIQIVTDSQSTNGDCSLHSNPNQSKQEEIDNDKEKHAPTA